MKVVITGGFGFVGTHLSKYLLEKGYAVTVIAKSVDHPESIDPRLQVIEADLAKKGKWQTRLKDFDVVVHLASQISASSPEPFKKNNVAATKNLIDALIGVRIKKIVHVSSAAVTSLRRDWYSDTKSEQEKLMLKMKNPMVVLRPSMIYGPNDTKNIGWLIKMLSKLPAVPLPGKGSFGRQPVYVLDFCQIIEKNLKRAFPKKIYEIHGYEYISMRKMVVTILAESKQRKLLINIPTQLLLYWTFINERVNRKPKFTTDQIKSLISGERFNGDDWAKIFSIKPTNFKNGIRSMVKS